MLDEYNILDAHEESVWITLKVAQLSEKFLVGFYARQANVKGYGKFF